jgi:hypothetical protein
MYSSYLLGERCQLSKITAAGILIHVCLDGDCNAIQRIDLSRTSILEVLVPNVAELWYYLFFSTTPYFKVKSWPNRQMH